MAAGPQNARSVYLITYSQANLQIVNSREKFADIILEAFAQGTSSNPSNPIIQWCCSQENHADGNLHYHMVIKLRNQRRWLATRNSIDKTYNIKVHFSDTHTNYYDAWKYVTKSDVNAICSTQHPDLTNPPRTTAASSSKRKNSGGPSTRAKKKRFDALDLSNIIIKHNIRTDTELLSFAHGQKVEGKNDVCLYLLNNKQKCINIIKTTWDMENAGQLLQRQKKSRMDILQEALESDCIQDCNGQWKTYAVETLQNNHIHVQYFANKIKNALVEGRGKMRNILVVGPANCGKTFILKPLTKIYNAFVNPATGSFAWLGIENGEVIMLNDFRWCEKIISWQDFLKLLEGDVVHIPSPKTHFAQDIIFNKDTPIFCTAAEEFAFYSHGKHKQIESDMMKVRWETFTFFHQITVMEAKEIPPCPKCFAELILVEQL